MDNITDEQLLEDDSAEEIVPEEVSSGDKYEEELGVPERLVKVLVSIVNSCEEEDRDIRLTKLREYKENELYWRGINAFYSEVAHDWRVPSISDLTSAGLSASTANKVMNVIKPYGESIVAALSSTLPGIAFIPDDADSVEDMSTARAYSKIERLLRRHNKSGLLFMKAVWIMYKEGLVAGRNYTHESKDYGTYEKENYETVNKQIHNLTCPECGESADFETLPMEPGQPMPCPACGMEMVPDVQTRTETFEQFVGVTNEPKSRECFEVYGPLYVKLPHSARCQKDCGYLSLRFEQDKDLLQEVYSSFAKDIDKAGYADLIEERNARLSVEANGDGDSRMLTVRQTWLRTWKFNTYGFDKEEVIELKELFPEGCCVTTIGNDVCVDITTEKLDEHWTITEHPLANNIHADPLMTSAKPIQDAQSDIFNLGIQTIEHGIAETFADPDVLDFDSYSQEEASPGMLYQAKPKPGKSLADAFHTLKSATLSEEYSVFKRGLDNAGEFVTGAFPSVYGGDSGGSKTATEYQQSRTQALQRLNISWKILAYWWTDMMCKSVISYAKALKEAGYDEKFAEKVGTNYVNVWVKQTELTGKVGSVEPEAAEQLPMTVAQQRDFIMSLMQMKDENLSAMLYHPSNTPVLRKVAGLDELYIPGEDARNKQFAEFIELLEGIPVAILPTDDHQVESETCRSWLNSATGLTYKKLNPEGYQNIIQHWMEHEQNKQMMLDAGIESEGNIESEDTSNMEQQ